MHSNVEKASWSKLCMQDPVINQTNDRINGHSLFPLTDLPDVCVCVCEG
jgi:hypothetical protein